MVCAFVHAFVFLAVFQPGSGAFDPIRSSALSTGVVYGQLDYECLGGCHNSSLNSSAGYARSQEDGTDNFAVVSQSLWTLSHATEIGRAPGTAAVHTGLEVLDPGPKRIHNALDTDTNETTKPVRVQFANDSSKDVAMSLGYEQASVTSVAYEFMDQLPVQHQAVGTVRRLGARNRALHETKSISSWTFTHFLRNTAKALNYLGFLVGIACVVAFTTGGMGNIDSSQRLRQRLPPPWGPQMAMHYSSKKW